MNAFNPRQTVETSRRPALSPRSVRKFISAFLVTGVTHMVAGSVSLHMTGQWQTSSVAEDLAVDGHYAYVADYFDGLQVISIIDPTSPQKVGALWTGGGTWSVALSGGYAYVADDKSGLQVVDISNPVAPSKIGEWTNAPCTKVRVFGKYAFAETSLAGSGRVKVLDMSDPRNPAEIASVFYVPQALAANGRAYAANLYLGLIVLDWHDPANPQTLGSYDTNPDSPSTTSVTASESYAYATDNDFFGMKGRGLVIIDVSNPTNPQPVGEHMTRGSADLVAIAVERAFVASHDWIGGAGYLQMFDVSNPTKPELLDAITLSSATAMVVEDNYVYLTAGGSGPTNGLKIVKVVEGPRLSPPFAGTSGDLRLLISGAVGEIVRLQYSSDLQTWSDWQTVTLTNRSLEVIDPSGWVASRRFYRAVSP